MNSETSHNAASPTANGAAAVRVVGSASDVATVVSNLADVACRPAAVSAAAFTAAAAASSADDATTSAITAGATAAGYIVLVPR